MEPMHNFVDHPSLKGMAAETIYWMDGRFYLATDRQLAEIYLKSLDSDNMGEPFRQFARLSFAIVDTQKSTLTDSSILIDIEDAAKLYIYNQQNNIGIRTSVELSEDASFNNHWQNLMAKQ